MTKPANVSDLAWTAYCLNANYFESLDDFLEEWDEDEESDDCDLEMGFDPYMGCYSYDC